MFKKMSLVECNYEIYDKKLLAIIKIFEKWRSKCVETLVKNSMKVLTNHKNLKHFMTSKQLNRKQARWAKFLSKFNFRIIYRFEVQNIKSNNLTRRFENLLKNIKNERTQFNYQTLLKIKNLDSSMRKVIKMTLDLMNEREKSVIRIAIMMYDLIEKEVFANEKSIEKSFASNLETSINEKSIEKLLVEKFIDQSNIMQQILKTYFQDDVFQRVMKAKRSNQRKISIDLVRKELKLKLKDCEIKENLFWMKNRIYVLEKKSFYANIIKQTHESLLESHAKRDAIYDKINMHYYWSRMINIVAQYIKTCHVCKRTKIYRDDKHELLKSLSISKRYFQNISMNFIISLLVCKRYDKSYEHIMIVVNKLFKKKRFMTLNSFSVNIVIQAFVEWIWKEENYSMTIVFDRNIQFISHFWRRLCERIDTTFKLSIAWHSKTNDQTKNANENLKVYFRVYVSYNQDDWVNYLLMIEFEINFVKSNSTRIESFLATKRYLLKSSIESFISIIANSMTRKEMKNVDKLIEKLEILRIYLREKSKWAQDKMKK